jgi:hypothetical protein
VLCPAVALRRDVNQPGNFETSASLQGFTCPAEPAAAYRMPYATLVGNTVSLRGTAPAAAAANVAAECHIHTHIVTRLQAFERAQDCNRRYLSMLLQVKCPMFSRKWAFSTNELVFKVLTDASETAGVLLPRHMELRIQQEGAAAAAAAAAAQPGQTAAQGSRKAALLSRWLQQRKWLPSG